MAKLFALGGLLLGNFLDGLLLCYLLLCYLLSCFFLSCHNVSPPFKPSPLFLRVRSLARERRKDLFFYFARHKYFFVRDTEIISVYIYYTLILKNAKRKKSCQELKQQTHRSFLHNIKIFFTIRVLLSLRIT